MSQPTLKQQLIRSGIGSLIIKVSNLLIELTIAILLARALGPEGYGIYAFALSLVMILTIPAQIGLPALLVREVARYQLQEQWQLMRGLLKRADQAVLVISLGLILVSLIVLSFGGPFSNPSQTTTLIWALFLIPLLALGNVRGACIRGLRYITLGQLPEMIVRPGLLLLLAGIIYFADRLTPEWTMAVHVVAALFALIIAAGLRRHKLPEACNRARLQYDSAWIKSIIPFSFLAGMHIINRQTDIVMLGYLSGSHEVGLYRVAAQASMLVAFGLSLVNVVVAPHIARLYAADDMQRLQRLLTRGARISLLIAVPITALFWLFGDPILRVIFGSEYTQAHLALGILCFGQLINALAGSVGYILNMTGNETTTAKIVALSALINIILNATLIPAYGINGAATATAISLCVWNLLLAITIRKRLGLDSTAIGQNLVS